MRIAEFHCKLNAMSSSHTRIIVCLIRHDALRMIHVHALHFVCWRQVERCNSNDDDDDVDVDVADDEHRASTTRLYCD